MAYATIQDILDEGYGSCGASASRMQRLLDDASAFIEQATGRWFEPRTLTIRETWRNERELLLETPIARVDELRFVNIDGSLQTAMPATDYRVFNRHATEGLLNPDDRENPRVALLFVSPNLIIPRIRPATIQEVTAARVLQLQVSGVFGYTQPTFNRARAIGASGADSVTAAGRIVTMKNASFTDADVGHTLTIAGSLSNDGDKTITRRISGEQVVVAEALVDEGTGFTATIVDFPQLGIVPAEIRNLCRDLAIDKLTPRASRDPLDAAITAGRLRRLQTRDQSIDLMADQRTTGQTGGSITGNPEYDDVLIRYRRPASFGAA